jgi:hypothetical protein
MCCRFLDHVHRELHRPGGYRPRIASIMAAVIAFFAKDRLTGRPDHADEPNPARAA